MVLYVGCRSSELYKLEVFNVGIRFLLTDSRIKKGAVFYITEKKPDHFASQKRAPQEAGN